MPAGAQDAPADRSDLQPFADCVRNEGRVAALLVVDQSGSLKTTDPDAQRVAGLEAALTGLAELTAGEGAAEVQVGIGGFDVGYEQVVPFQDLTVDSSGPLRDRVDAFAERETGFDTDYVAALTAAQRQLADQVVAMDPDGTSQVCKLLLVLTDGKFDIEDRLTDSQRDRFGASKPWADDVDLGTEGSGAALVERGRDVLCREGGLMDELRSSDVFSAIVALETEIAEPDRTFLQAMAQGEAGGQSCGTPGPDAEDSGAYIPATDVDGLIAALFEAGTSNPPVPPGEEQLPGCPESDTRCTEGTKSFELDESLSRFNVLALTASGSVRVVLRGPDGGEVELARSGARAASVSGAELTWTWLTESALLLSGDLPTDPSTWVGTWDVTFVDPEGAGGELNRVSVYVFGDLQAELVEGAELRKGEAGQIGVRLVDAAGQPRSSEALRAGADLTATVDVAGEPTQDVPLTAADDGVFRGEYTPASDLTAGVANLHVDVAVTTSFGVTLPAVGTDSPITLLNPVGFPQIVTSEDGVLHLSPIDQDSVASGAFSIVAGPDDAGCVWLDASRTLDVPSSAGEVSYALSDGGSEGSCVAVEGDEQREVTLEADADGTAAGTVSGELVLNLRSDATDEVRTEVIPFEFEMSRPIDRAKEAWTLLVLVLGGLGIPVLLLYLVNYASAKFEPFDRRRYLAVPVTVRGDRIVRTDGGDTILLGSEIRWLERLEERRGFTLEGLSFRARMPRLPFSAPSGRVAPAEGEVLVTDRGAMPDGETAPVNLGLGGTWVFAFVPPTPGAEEVDGQLVCVFGGGDEPFDAQVERFDEELDRELPDKVWTLVERLPADAQPPAPAPRPRRLRLRPSDRPDRRGAVRHLDARRPAATVVAALRALVRARRPEGLHGGTVDPSTCGSTLLRPARRRPAVVRPPLLTHLLT